MASSASDAALTPLAGASPRTPRHADSSALASPRSEATFAALRPDSDPTAAAAAAAPPRNGASDSAEQPDVPPLALGGTFADTAATTPEGFAGAHGAQAPAPASHGPQLSLDAASEVDAGTAAAVAARLEALLGPLEACGVDENVPMGVEKDATGLVRSV